MSAYYNERDPYAAAWLRNLIAAGLIAPGDVDERSIADVRPDDLAGYEQCHFFAGIGGWSHALRLAGWPDGRPVWTGSCPCQPFSAAGAGKAADDERHLWPRWFPLIAERRPAIVFGEQVEAAIGWGWLDAVFADLEGEGYACGAAVLPACGVGAPHIRQRCWFVGHADSTGRAARNGQCFGNGERPTEFAYSGAHRIVANADGRHASTEGLQRGGEYGQRPEDGRSLLLAHAAIEGRSAQPRRPSGTDGRASAELGRLRDTGRLGDANGARSQGRREYAGEHAGQRSPWAASALLPCTDGKARPVEPGTFPLVTRLSEGMGSDGSGSLSPYRTIFDPSTGKPIGQAPWRIGMLRAYGNAIVPQVAAEFVSAYMEIA